MISLNYRDLNDTVDSKTGPDLEKGNGESRHAGMLENVGWKEGEVMKKDCAS